MRKFPLCSIFAIAVLVLTAHTVLAEQSPQGLLAENINGQVTVRGEHFRFTCDAARGGQIADLRLFDGKEWNRVLGADGQTCPALRIEGGKDLLDLSNCRDARIENYESSREKATWTVSSAAGGKGGTRSPWRVTLSYEVYAEGALFIDVKCELLPTTWDFKNARIEFRVDKSIVDAAKYRQSVFARPKTVLPAGRIAFGMNSARSFSNEIEVIVERNAALGKQTGFAEKPGRFIWQLGTDPAVLKKGYTYRNRMAIGMTCPVSGKPQTNLLGQRVYHWINYLDRKAMEAWYPTERQIDQMADNGGTMLILHQDWMRQGGSNGNPHADYSAAKHEQTIRRVIDKAHQRGMRVGLYRRGIEAYSLGQVFDRYLKRNWDGFYVDWHGPHAVAEHEMKNRPDAKFGDKHYSKAGELLAAREYFLFTKKMRKIVGPGGFLIGHMGFGSAGIFPNLCFDAFLPGEHHLDHRMFFDRDDAVFRGMTCGTVCMPWPLDSPHFTKPDAIAKMAAWGFYPHVGLGIQRKADTTLFPLDPDAKANSFALDYWRVLSKIDAERATAFNLPNQSRVAMRSSIAAVEGVIYAEDKNGRRDYLVIVANLGSKPAKATLTLDSKVLGMSGKYNATRIDSRSGASSPQAIDGNHIDTPLLEPYEIMGFKLEKTE
ncbi:MAG: hypothetical protein JXM70_21625 [Pirellulales bacterium]|nr:hypothetical protein [Pirellulales bacterium]